MVDSDDSQAAELYDPTSGSFTSAGAKLVPYDDFPFSAELLTNGKALESFADVCGYDYEDLYDPLNDTFVAAGNLNYGIGGPATPLPDGTVLMTTGGLEAELYGAGNPCDGMF